MSGQPPVLPPSLSYKSKAEREREQAEQEERERQERERLEAERRELEAAGREAAPPPPATPPPLPLAEVPDDEDEARTEEPPPPAPTGLAMFEEDRIGLTPEDLEGVEMLGAPEAAEVVEEEEEVEEEIDAGPPRLPPRPPKSPDMRPVYAGFILVSVGLVQVVFGIWMMVQTPNVASGTWSQLTKWGYFSLGFTALFLGLLAIRGGLWSFRKERFSVVKVGAIAATVCVWALWVPWLFGLLALLIITRAREEYYPFYDPSWDAPSWIRPPHLEGEEEPEGDEEEEASEEEPHAHVDHEPEAVGLSEAHTEPGSGWEDIV
jgi:hypothetical protein